MRKSFSLPRKWLLACLSLALTGFMMMASAGANPAAAEEPPNEMTLSGITMRWTKPDLSDVVITETPGKADKLPYGLTAAELRKVAAEGAVGNSNGGKLPGVSKRTSGEVSILAAPNGCSYSPDRWFKANFKPTCDSHDRCYSSSSYENRLTCDQMFIAGLNTSCYVAYRGTAVRLSTCQGVALTYYAAVCNLGSCNYKGKGLNN